MAGALTLNPGAVSEEIYQGTPAEYDAEGNITVAATDPSISQTAQDVAKAQGVAYSDIATSALAQNDPDSEDYQDPNYADYGAEKVKSTIGSNIDFSAGEGKSYVDSANSTVSGQLNALLGSDSPYIKQAEQQAAEQAQSRGLLNSTLAAQAGREAAISQALPIAQQDAQTYAQSDLATQQAQQNVQTIQAEAIVSGEMVKQQAQITQANQNINNAFSAQIQAASEQSKVWLQDMQNQFNTGIQDMQIEAQRQLSEMELTATAANVVREQTGSILQNYQISVENMLTNPEFLAQGADAVNNALKQLEIMSLNGIQFVGASYSEEMADSMGDYLEAYMGWDTGEPDRDYLLDEEE